MPTSFSDFLHIFLWITVAILCLWFLISYYLFQKEYKAVKIRAEVKAKKAAEQKPREWTSDYLQTQRLESDELADKTVAHILSHGNEKEVVNKLFITLTSNDQALPDDLDPVLKNYFEQSSKLPDWADPDLRRFGHDFYLQNGVLICMLLFYKSLPECYTGAKGSSVLLQTAQLNDRSKNLNKLSMRLAYTGTFIYRAMKPGALQPQNSGIIATQKIRLIHAVARYYILHRQQPPWDTETLGIPINQEDMAGTLMAFSALVLEGLEMLGVTMTLAERESYIHCWAIIGHILGVKEELIPVNATEALALGHAVINHQMGASEAGTKLTEALLNFCNKKSPSFVSEAFHRSMMRFLMGDKLSDMLGLEAADSKNSNRFIRFVKNYIWIREQAKKSLFLCFILQEADRIILRFSYQYLSKTPSNNINFRLPNNLEDGTSTY